MATTAKDIRLLFRARRAPKAIDLPGTVLDCAIRLLSDGEIDECREAAAVWIDAESKRMSLDLAKMMHIDPELHEREKIRQMLWRAFVQPVTDPDADTRPLFESVDVVRELDAVMVSELFEAYLDLQDARTAKRTLEPAAVELLAATLCGPDGDEILSSTEAASLRALVRSLAERVRSQAKGT